MHEFFKDYGDEVAALVASRSTTEPSYYPAIKALLSKMLAHESLPFDVRASTSESRSGGGHDQPDFALYDGKGDYLVVAGEVKLPSEEIREIAFSEERNDQIGRYLAQTGVVLISNVRGFGLVTIQRGVARTGEKIAPKHRVLEHSVELWPSKSSIERHRAIPPEAIEELYLLVETAVTRYAPIAEPESLAKILARQAKRAKAQLPAEFTQAVKGLADDFGKALGVTFEGEEGEEFFRSSLIQTVFYGLFAGWTLWLRSGSKEPFRWENLAEHLTIPFLAELYYEFQHPRRIQELGLRPHLDLATETLHRVDTEAFFRHFELPSLKETDTETTPEATAAILYFYEPFLEAFDPELRKSLGVWYTPREVVRYQVRTIDRLLREELGCDKGFADDKVVVLDPCCGTGAYLIEVMKCMAEQLESEGSTALMGQALLDAATRRFIGFELLTAPFVIAQLQMFLILSELGAKPTATHRPAIFLTNALTGWDGPEQMKLHFPELQAEYDAAHAVKRSSKIIVVIGNPPYNRFAGVPLAEESDLVDHYKGIRRDDKGRQVGPSELYTRWGIRKQLLDDLYIRFFRLAERCIGERAEYGIVSFISNYSFYTGRSHPLMRASLVRSFDEIWIDCLNGDKYKTGKVIPKGLPGEGTTDQSIFTTEHDPRGIQVGTGITTLLKRGDGHAKRSPVVHYRNYWGRSHDKRTALLNSFHLYEWPTSKKATIAKKPSGPRAFEAFEPSEQSRWKLVPFSAQGGFDDWPALDQLFVVKFQGVNPNRGLDGSAVEIDRTTLLNRMRDYFSDTTLERLRERHPVLMQNRARYDAADVRTELRAGGGFDENKIVPYVVFPLDERWLYYETENKFLNEARADLFKNLKNNEFLVTVPEPRKESETRPIVLTTAFDLHLHDRGSVSFPVETIAAEAMEGTLFASRGGTSPPRHSNLAPSVWSCVKEAFDLKGDLSGKDARSLARDVARLAMAICHAPLYQSEHKESLAQDWAHVPIPKSRTLFDELVVCGGKLTILLNPAASASRLLKGELGEELKQLAVPTKTGGGAVAERDLVVEYSFFGGSQGGWRSRSSTNVEPMYDAWGVATGDLYINDAVSFRHVPERVWHYELGGYPVIKKWLGYRDRGRRPGVALTIQETNHLRGIVHRLAAVLRLNSTLDNLYEQACKDCFSTEELGL